MLRPFKIEMHPKNPRRGGHGNAVSLQIYRSFNLRRSAV